MTRLGRRAAAALVGATLALTAAPVGAVSSAPLSDESPRLSRTDLPTTAQLAQVFPALTGGSRHFYRVPSLGVAGARDCLGYRELATPSQGVWASYSYADGGSAYGAGAEEALPYVYEFATEGAAQRAMTRLGRYLARCAGHHVSHGISNRLTRLADPALGDESLAYRVSGRYFTSTTGRTTRRELHVVVRTGDRLVDGYLATEELEPSLANAVRLADLTLTSSS